MFTFILALVFLAAGAIFFWLNTKNSGNSDALNDWGVCSWFLALVFTVVSIIATLFAYSNQKKDFRELKRLCATEKIYTDKADALTAKFAGYLAVAYPQHEREIFQNISPENVGFYVVKYPDIKANETFMVLVNEINKLQTDRYDQQLTRENVLKEMSFRSENPWRFYWFIPTLEDLQQKNGTACQPNNQSN